MRQEGELVQEYESRGQRLPTFLPSNFNPLQLSEMFSFSLGGYGLTPRILLY